ncbi:MAG: transposase [Rhodospirillales bacterium]|nr:transposase [Acetobacter sp.]
MRCANHRGGRGYDAGKKVLGRKRHLVVDTLGLILGVLVTPANVSDPAGSAQLLPEVVGRFGWLRHFWATARTPASKSWTNSAAGTRTAVRSRGCPRQGRYPRPCDATPPPDHRAHLCLADLQPPAVRDYEAREVSSEAMILLAMSNLMLKRLAKRTFRQPQVFRFRGDVEFHAELLAVHALGSAFVGRIGGESFQGGMAFRRLPHHRIRFCTVRLVSCA